jgi:hypothetical protein
MAYLTLVGYVPENLTELGARGYHVYRRGKKVRVVWGPVTIVRTQTSGFIWERTTQHKIHSCRPSQPSLCVTDWSSPGRSGLYTATDRHALEPFGGAVSRIGLEETAFPHRRALCSLAIVGMWTDPAESPINVRWTRDFWSAMQPFSSDAVYVNYLDTDDAGRVPAAYGAATYQRLRLVKERYDPGNFFRMNQNIGVAI